MSRRNGATLKDLIDHALEDEHEMVASEDPWARRFEALSVACQATAAHPAFTTGITATICLVAVFIGLETDWTLHCER